MSVGKYVFDLPTPSPLKVEAVTETTIKFTWTISKPEKVAPGLKYCVQMKKKVDYIFKTAYEGDDLHCVITNLKPSTMYNFKIRCFTGEGYGDWSPELLIETHYALEQLHKAVEKNDVKKVRYILIENPKFKDYPDVYGASPLMLASRYGCTEVVDLLLKEKADPHYANAVLRTSLMEACSGGHLEVVNLLYEAKCSWLVEDKVGRTALNMAVLGGNCAIVAKILADKVPADYVGKKSTNNMTPLQYLAGVSTGSPTIAQLLITYDADVNRRTDNGTTVLMLTYISRNIEVAKVLLKNGANVSAKDKRNKTVYDMAASRIDEPEEKQMAELFKEAMIEQRRSQ